MSNAGVIIGFALVLLVAVVAWLLGRKANHGVRNFRAEHHERFLGRK